MGPARCYVRAFDLSVKYTTQVFLSKTGFGLDLDGSSANKDVQWKAHLTKKKSPFPAIVPAVSFFTDHKVTAAHYKKNLLQSIHK
jgi:hypothetical protein